MGKRCHGYFSQKIRIKMGKKKKKGMANLTVQDFMIRTILSYNTLHYKS